MSSLSWLLDIQVKILSRNVHVKWLDFRGEARNTNLCIFIIYEITQRASIDIGEEKFQN